jgi:hypothetical protein
MPNFFAILITKGTTAQLIKKEAIKKNKPREFIIVGIVHNLFD